MYCPHLINCVLWGDGPDEIDGYVNASFSDVQGGWTGASNIDVNPLFVAPNDLRLSPGSPCIDAGDNTAVPASITTDLDGNPRFVDDPDSPDCWQLPGICGDPPVVDMGAYEFQLCPCDCEETPDGTVDVGDFLALLAQWGTPGPCDCEDPPDGAVDVGDFLAILAAWGPCA